MGTRTKYAVLSALFGTLGWELAPCRDTVNHSIRRLCIQHHLHRPVVGSALTHLREDVMPNWLRSHGVKGFHVMEFIRRLMSWTIFACDDRRLVHFREGTEGDMRLREDVKSSRLATRDNSCPTRPMPLSHRETVKWVKTDPSTRNVPIRLCQRSPLHPATTTM